MRGSRAAFFDPVRRSDWDGLLNEYEDATTISYDSLGPGPGQELWT